MVIVCGPLPKYTSSASPHCCRGNSTTPTVPANRAVTVLEGSIPATPSAFLQRSRAVALAIPCSDQATPGADDQKAPMIAVVLFSPACFHVLRFCSPRPRCAPRVNLVSRVVPSYGSCVVSHTYILQTKRVGPVCAYAQPFLLQQQQCSRSSVIKPARSPVTTGR